MRNSKILLVFLFLLTLLAACGGSADAVDTAPDIAVESSPGADTTPLLAESPVGEDIDLANLFIPFWESWGILHENYVHQPLDDFAMLDGAVLGLTSLLEDHDLEIPEPDEDDLYSYEQLETLAIKAQTPRAAETLFIPFWELWLQAETLVMDTDITYEKMMQSALRGMVDSLDDPHTTYMDPSEFRQINIPLEGEYEGIGAWVDTSGDYLTIVTPMEGSPAERAGLMPGDQILAVDDMDMEGVDGDLVIRYVIGPAGTQVVLLIQREGVAEPFEVEITRERIVIHSLASEMLDNDIAYIHLFNFGENSANEFEVELAALLEQNPRGLILDLRNNGGGFLEVAVDIASEFFDEGVVLYEEYGSIPRETFEVRPGGIATEIPLVILINGGTASASEIVAGMVQDYGRGTLVGTTSFGKGSVQIPFVLSGDRGGIRVTHAMWLTPEERLIHGLGLTPDIIVEVTQEDIDAELDPQLEMAIQVLLGTNG
ncbi:MAG: S41 family peptidase [Anaerolineae bacterium]|nr:S41 family peptidase [Anaerolineae bacterium]